VTEFISEKSVQIVLTISFYQSYILRENDIHGEEALESNCDDTRRDQSQVGLGIRSYGAELFSFEVNHRRL
jgi:hypothetical protein